MSELIEIPEINDRPECCICSDYDTNLIMLKCHHKHVVCFACSKQITKCPLCRVKLSYKKAPDDEEEHNELLKKYQILQIDYQFLRVSTNKEKDDLNLRIESLNKLVGTLQNDFDTLRRILKIS
jgi:hypothetical protein